MSGLPFNLDAAFSRFLHPTPLRVTETLGRRTRGRYVVEDLPERSIRAIIFAIQTRRLEFLSAGDASVSGINIICREVLHYPDPREEETENRQSYVHYKEYKYRVHVDAMTWGNTTFNAYDCLRYMDL